MALDMVPDTDLWDLKAQGMVNAATILLHLLESNQDFDSDSATHCCSLLAAAKHTHLQILYG